MQIAYQEAMKGTEIIIFHFAGRYFGQVRRGAHILHFLYGAERAGYQRKGDCLRAAQGLVLAV